MFVLKPDFYLQLPEILHLFCTIIASVHVTQVMIIFIIKTIYSLYTLIYKKEIFEVRNSPLNKYASILSKALYCLKFGCTATGAGASFIAGGMAYDAVLEEAGRERRFLPFIGKVYKGVFGEVHKNLGNNSPFVTGQTPTPNKKEVESVTEMITKYHNMSESEKKEFMAEINSSFKK
jgi:hypothetical protein